MDTDERERGVERAVGGDERELTEARTVELARRAGLPAPDEVEYRETSIVLLWHERKLAVVVDEIPTDEPAAGNEASCPGGAAPTRASDPSASGSGLGGCRG